jgi:hypothetical protein
MEAYGDADGTIRLDQLSIPHLSAGHDDRARRKKKKCSLVGLLRSKLVAAHEFGCVLHGLDRVLSVDPVRNTQL